MTDPTIIEAETGAIAAVSKLPPDEAKNKRAADYFLQLAQAMEVKTPEQYEEAAEELRKIVARHTELDAERRTFTDPLNAVLDKLNARFMPYLKALRGDGKKDTVSAESIIKAKMVKFKQDEAEELKRKQAEADRKAEEERQRLADAAEAQRREAEAQAAALLAEAGKGKKAQQAAQEQAAVVLRQADEQADALRTAAAVVVAAPVAAPVRATGVSTAGKLEYEITDPMQFLAHILEKRRDLLSLVEFNATKMRALAALQGEATDIPGLRVFRGTTIRVR